jgi:DNA modification methylase
MGYSKEKHKGIFNMSKEGELGLQGFELFQGDCLEVMKNIQDGSVDMILADPP